MKTLPQALALGTAQTIAWASSTYLPAILAQPIAAELGVSTASVFGAFSLSLVVMALAGPPVGRGIDTAARAGRGSLRGDPPGRRPRAGGSMRGGRTVPDRAGSHLTRFPTAGPARRP